jgi:hypothetical protein
MSDTEIESIANHMREIFGDNIPSPVHEPTVFNYYLKLYVYYYRNDLIL